METKETLKRIRIYLAMTQQQFADYIGVSKRTIFLKTSSNGDIKEKYNG